MMPERAPRFSPDDEILAAQIFMNCLTGLYDQAHQALGHRQLGEAADWHANVVWFNAGAYLGRACLQSGCIEIINQSSAASYGFAIDANGRVRHDGADTSSPGDLGFLSNLVARTEDFAVVPAAGEL